jgi:hypothetical protein
MKATETLKPGSEAVRLLRWRGGSHPTEQAIRMLLAREGIQPYAWTQRANFRYPLRNHAHAKVLYCVEGSLEVLLPDLNQRVTLRRGDRLELPRNMRYALIVGPNGARCLEGEKSAFVN